MIIDNFDIIRSHLDFIDPKRDRYIIHILRRVKDISENMKNALGSNESQRLIKTYYIDSLEYFDNKRAAIIELCRANNARAYIIPQPRDNFECLINLGEKIFETIRLSNYSVKPEHLIRQAYCGCHKTRKKQWIIDLDKDEMVETKIESLYGGQRLGSHEWTLDGVQNLVKEQLTKIGKDPERDMYTVPTKHGWHIVTSPFNLQEASEKCSLLFEGQKHVPIKLEVKHLTKGDPYFRNIPSLDTKYFVETKEITGWLHKDGMTVLYMETKDETSK